MDSISKIAVIGAGMMGSEIALSFAFNGANVILKDISLDLSMAGKQKAEKILKKWEEKGKIDSDKIMKTLDFINPQDDNSGFEDVDLVIEAALEDVKIKSRIFKELDGVCKEDCIFATNTSSIPVTQLAASTSRPGLFIGMHFFSPVSVMKLVEIIPGIDTADGTVDKAMNIIREIGKEPVRVTDRAGFLVNRLLFAFFNEAWRMVNEGSATPEDIDKAVKLGLGHPVGIFQLQDLVGLDNALYVSGVLSDEYGERFKAPPILKRMVAANHIGRKVKKGWFDYDK